MRKFHIKHEKTNKLVVTTICSVNFTLTVTVYCKRLNCKPPYLIHAAYYTPVYREVGAKYMFLLTNSLGLIALMRIVHLFWHLT